MKEGIPQISNSREPLPDWREVADPFWQKVTAFMKLDALFGQLDEVVIYDDGQVQQWLDDHDLAAFYTPEIIQREYEARKLSHLLDKAFEHQISTSPKEAAQEHRNSMPPLRQNDLGG